MSKCPYSCDGVNITYRNQGNGVLHLEPCPACQPTPAPVASREGWRTREELEAWLEDSKTAQNWALPVQSPQFQALCRMALSALSPAPTAPVADEGRGHVRKMLEAEPCTCYETAVYDVGGGPPEPERVYCDRCLALEAIHPKPTAHAQMGSECECGRYTDHCKIHGTKAPKAVPTPDAQAGKATCAVCKLPKDDYSHSIHSAAYHPFTPAPKEQRP